MKKEIKYILFVFIILLALFSFQLLFHNKEYNESLPEVKLTKKESDNKSFAIMVQNGDNYEEYKSEDNIWPGDEYVYKEAKCIDNNGALVEEALTYIDGKVTLETNKTIYCTLYFDKKPKTTIEILRENDPQNKLSSEIVGGMYRYQGKNTDEINNYICFGTNKKEECTNEETGYDKYMYRIIGITEEGKLYLIKMKGVEEGKNKTFVWQQSSDCEGPICSDQTVDIEWPNVDIYKRLNGTASNGNPVFINNSRYEYMVVGNPWYNKIENHNWMYGDVGDGLEAIYQNEVAYGADNNGLVIYDIETGIKFTFFGIPEFIPELGGIVCGSGCKVFRWSADKSVNSKVSLMYLHDYYLAYDNENNGGGTSNWLLFINNKNTISSTAELLITRDWTNLVLEHGFPWVIKNDGSVYGNDSNNTEYIVRSTFYLLSTTRIKNGTGSITDPYILEVN